MAVPTFDEFFNPLLRALRNLGGSGTVSEIDEEVIRITGLTDEGVNEPHRGNRTKVGYRLAWTRNYLKRYGLLENSSRGVWALTPQGRQTESVDEEEVKRAVRLLVREEAASVEQAEEEEAPEVEALLWQEKLLAALLAMAPEAFERLCQRILRESGFTQVEVTGRSGDGGIDGKGIIRLGGFLGFHVVFQCKRYTGSVSSKEVRDFRGAMVGRSDKGLFLTTGSFTRDARTEASRDGAPPIDLVDGAQLVEKMKELGLGTHIKTEEVVEVDEDWVKGF